mgnify:FL=1
MQPKALDHFTIRPKNIEVTRDFYEKIVKLKVGYRPPFDFPGYWLYIGESPVVHLVGEGAPLNAYFSDHMDLDTKSVLGGGAVDHIAFLCPSEEFEPMKNFIEKDNIDHLHTLVPDLGLRQIFLKDPDGVRIELNYPAS